VTRVQRFNGDQTPYQQTDGIDHGQGYEPQLALQAHSMLHARRIEDEASSKNRCYRKRVVVSR
jgi:hypothetical protein